MCKLLTQVGNEKKIAAFTSCLADARMVLFQSGRTDLWWNGQSSTRRLCRDHDVSGSVGSKVSNCLLQQHRSALHHSVHKVCVLGVYLVLSSIMVRINAENDLCRDWPQ